MAAITLLSLPSYEPFPCPKKVWRTVVLPQIERCEKKSFPSSEVFDFTSELKKSNIIMLVILEDASALPKLVGYLVTMFPKFGNSATIHKICIQPAHRRSGIASTMLKDQFNSMRKKACPKAQLWVHRENMPAINLYMAIGFENMAEVEHYYGPGRSGVHMLLNL